MDKGTKEEQWVLVNIEPMVDAIAESAWAAETKNISTEQLYQLLVVEGIPEPVKQVREEWASMFFSLRTAYSELCSSYIKPIEDAATKKGDKDQGSVGAGTEGQDTEVCTGN